MNCLRRYQQTSNYGMLGQFLYSQNLPNKLNKNTNLNKNMVNWTSALNAVLKDGKEMKLYRGIRFNFNRNNELINKGFISASKNIKKAEMFSDGKIIEFTLPKHIKSFSFKYKSTSSNALNEEETLIERNTKFTNIKFKKKYNNMYIYTADLIKYYKPRNKSTIVNMRDLEIRLRGLTYRSNNEDSNFGD